MVYHNYFESQTIILNSYRTPKNHPKTAISPDKSAFFTHTPIPF